MRSLSEYDVTQAARRLSSKLKKTPLRYDQRSSSWLKLESLQETGSFKVRGALNAVLAQVELGSVKPVVAASAGNHGAGVAWAARHVGVRALIVVPVDAPQAKCDRIAQLGAQVLRHGECFDESLRYARAFARSNGWHLIHAFDDPDVIAGQGTIGRELGDADPDVVVVPIGGGGLAAGMALALRSKGVRVVGVQVKGLDAMDRALRFRPIQARPARSIADGLRVRRAGALTQMVCRRELECIVSVSEDEVRAAMAKLAFDHGLIVEGAGAVAYAALARVVGQRKVAVVSGGNIDSALAHQVLSDHIRSSASATRARAAAACCAI